MTPWLVNDWHYSAQEYLSSSPPATLVRWPSMVVSRCAHSVGGSQLLPCFGRATVCLFTVHHSQQHWVVLLCEQVLQGSSTPSYPGHTRWCLAICCPAWRTLSVGATAHMVEGLEEAARNLWSMWAIVFWRLKNSWPKDKCWVKYTNPLLPSSSFDLYEQSDELDSPLCFPFISWPPSSLVPLPTAAGHFKVIFHRRAMDVQSLRDSLLTQRVLSEIENKFWPLLLRLEMFHKQLLFL